MSSSGLSAPASVNSRAIALNSTTSQSISVTPISSGTHVTPVNVQVVGSRVASQVASSPNPEGDFEYFPKLPPELRLKIWKLAVPDPRFILITRDGQRPFHIRNEEVEELLWLAKSSALSPALLFTCRESRVETLKTYTLLQCVRKSGKPSHLRSRKLGRPIKQMDVYCDFGRDIVCLNILGRNDFLDQLTEKDRNRLAHLVVHGNYPFNSIYGRGDMPQDILQLPRLEELLLALNMSEYLKFKHCERFQADPDFVTRFPVWTRWIEKVVVAHKIKYPEGDDLLAIPGHFRNKDGGKL